MLLVFAVGAAALEVDSSVRMLKAAGRDYLAVTWVKVGFAAVQILPFVIAAVA